MEKLRTENDALKTNVTHLGTLLDKMSVDNVKQMQQINSMSSENATIKDENKRLKTNDATMKDEIEQLKTEVLLLKVSR